MDHQKKSCLPLCTSQQMEESNFTHTINNSLLRAKTHMHGEKACILYLHTCIQSLFCIFKGFPDNMNNPNPKKHTNLTLYSPVHPSIFYNKHVHSQPSSGH